VLSDASALVTTLNDAANTVAATRQEADAEIARSVERLNDLLSQFEELNRAVVKGTATGADVTDLLDKRDGVLALISEEIGVNVVTRENNDMVLYTDGGVTLFETSARKVEFTPTLVYGATTIGSQVFIDGVPVTGTTTMPLRSGRIVGLMEVRDVAAVTYQNQLDEIARAIIDIFDTGTAAGGLFTQVGLPPAGTLRPGLAADIRINPAYDPDQGGSLDELRDGDTNPTGDNSYSERLFLLIDRFNASRTFDAVAGIAVTGSLADFSASSVGWLEARRTSADTDAAYQFWPAPPTRCRPRRASISTTNSPCSSSSSARIRRPRASSR
jgi:flagellar hook-associated protein 1 FlgK